MTSENKYRYFNMKAIVACDTHYGIGIHNTLPNWKLKNDLKTFKTLTVGNGNNAVIMGKNTWLSIGEKPLLNRMNFVLSTTMAEKNETDVWFYNEADDLLNDIYVSSYDTVWIIGGSQIYDLFIDYCNSIYISRTHKEFKCTTFLSEKLISLINNNQYVVENEYEDTDMHNGYTRYIYKID
jgi:dihydrofolate reductase